MKNNLGALQMTDKEKSKKPKKNITKKRSNKYQKKISLYGMEEKEVLKELLKSPPMPKDEEKEE